MGKREVGGGFIAAAALVAAWLLPVTFPTLQSAALAACWVAAFIIFAFGLWLIFHRPQLEGGKRGGIPGALDAVDRGIVLGRLNALYITSHDGIPPRMAAGLELPPVAWLNEQLEQMGEKWRVQNVRGGDAETYDV